MVKEGQEAVLHIGVDLILLPEHIKGKAAAQDADDEPALGHPRHKAHTGEDEHEHQGAAHVAGDCGVGPHDQDQMAAQQGDGGNGFQVPVLLQVHQLPGQQSNENQLHDLHRLQIYREARNAQPGPVAGAAVHAQGGFQQENKHQARAQEPLPALADLRQVQHTHEHIGHDAQAQGRQLDNDIFIRACIVGGAGDHQAAKEGGAGTQGQQYQVHLADTAEEEI